MGNERLPVLDRDLAHKIIDSLTERHMLEMLAEEDDWKDEEKEVQVIRAWYSAIGHRNVDVFADLSESFIETQFYLNLVIGFYGWHPRSLFTPTPDYVKQIERGFAAEQKQKAGRKLTKEMKALWCTCGSRISSGIPSWRCHRSCFQNLMVDV